MTTLESLTDDQILKSRDKFLAAGVTPAQIQERIKDLRAHGTVANDVPDADISQSVLFSASVAGTASDEEWLAFVREGKMPDVVRLSDAQLELVRGGVIVFAIAVVMWYGGNKLYEVAPWPNVLA